MSDPINANPTIIDSTNLPTRVSDPKTVYDRNKELKSKITSLSLLTNDYFNQSLKEPVSKTNIANKVLKSIQPVEEDSKDLTDATKTLSLDNEEIDPIDKQEIFDLISTISDPEHPLTLAQLAVVNLDDITITSFGTKSSISQVLIKITPTITHCSLATLIGLGIRVRLERSLPARFRVKIIIKEGTHQSENQVNKQLNDKERVAAACENDQLLTVISQMLSSCK
ncbi:hypothetical protein KGF56_000682 [Candida oxycetoniae]|uniref:MIP18 family-like domain-containing protein n=1 Tax=Candida oxycetoniae TaxID=497107 RepID=A0AAI9X043_9ASCO|nr:uncharacterized protein KGF56_000682 [Candida oxycetoniae]KAI3406550.2 hypothetical protein KGF56_000682 [Candida oxycetoniae]